MKKILFINERLYGGGAERVMALLANKLSLIGYDVSIATFYYSNEKYDIDNKISIIEDIENKYEPWYTNTRFEIIIERLKKLSIIEKIFFINDINKKKVKPLRKILLDNNNDTIISFLPLCNIATILSSHGLKSKVIVCERNIPNDYRLNNVVKKVRDKLYEKSDVCVFQTKEIMEYYNDTIKRKSTIIHNPINPLLAEPYIGKRKKVITNYCGYKKQKKFLYY